MNVHGSNGVNYPFYIGDNLSALDAYIAYRYPYHNFSQVRDLVYRTIMLGLRPSDAGVTNGAAHLRPLL